MARSRTRARPTRDTSPAAEYAGTAAAAERARNPAETPPDPRGGGIGRAPGTRAPQGRGSRRGSRAGLARGERWFDQSAREAGRISFLPPKRITAKDTSGFLVGMFVYTLALNYVRHGPEGAKGWLAAKFLNKPWTPDTDDDRKRGGAGGPGDVGHGGTARAEPADDRGLDSTRPKGPVAV